MPEGEAKYSERNFDDGGITGRLFDAISSDLYYVGGKIYMIYYIIYPDQLSGYPLVKEWRSYPTAKEVIVHFREYFALFGKPIKLKSNGGTQFGGVEMQELLDEYSMEHGQSSPYNPQPNGHAQQNVGIVKKLILKTGNNNNSNECVDGVEQIPNTHRSDGISLFQVVFGRTVRTLILELK